jgi:hypothetical protein
MRAHCRVMHEGLKLRQQKADAAARCRGSWLPLPQLHARSVARIGLMRGHTGMHSGAGASPKLPAEASIRTVHGSEAVYCAAARRKVGRGEWRKRQMARVGSKIKARLRVHRLIWAVWHGLAP